MAGQPEREIGHYLKELSVSSLNTSGALLAALRGLLPLFLHRTGGGAAAAAGALDPPGQQKSAEIVLSLSENAAVSPPR